MRRADQLLERFDPNSPGCVLLDLYMPQINGLQLQERLSELDAAQPIIFLSGRGSIPASVKAIQAGANDFICKPVTKQQLLSVVGRAISRNHEILAARAKRAEFHARVASLTPREKQVYALVIAGKLNKQIAYELNTTERTIKAHRHNVMMKMRARSLIELIWISEYAATGFAANVAIRKVC